MLHTYDAGAPIFHVLYVLAQPPGYDFWTGGADQKRKKKKKVTSKVRSQVAAR